MRNSPYTTIRWAALVVAFLILSALLAACGGDDNSDSDDAEAADIPTANYDQSVVDSGQRNYGIF